MTRLSIHARVLLMSLAALLAVGAVTALFTYRRAVHEVDELVDAQLAQYARIMLALGHEGEDDEVEPPDIHGHAYASRLLFQMWRRDDGRDTLLVRSPEAPVHWPEEVSREGYSVARIGGIDWRCFAASHDEGERQVLVALDLAIRNDLARDIALGNLKPYLFGLPVLAVLLLLGIRGGLAPLRRMEAELSSRSPERLDPLPENGSPRELHPLVRAMNGLFGRMGRALDNERRFTSDAAHELRTPLAALKVQLQVAQRTSDETERRGAVEKALRGADRMAHLVSQLLSLARLEAAAQAEGGVAVDLGELAREAVAELEPAAREKDLRLEARLAAARLPAGNPELLRALIRNLLDNTLRYVPAGGRVEISLTQPADSVELRVADDGPGVARAERERLGERFHRIGCPAAEGVGLGLSIARRIAELHGARVSFGEGLDGRGLGVTVSFPLADT